MKKKIQSHSNTAILCKLGKALTDLNMSFFILFHFTCLSSILRWNWKVPIIKVIEIFELLATYQEWYRIWISPMENCFYSILWVYFSLEIEKFRFWKSLKYFNIFRSKQWCQLWIRPVNHCLIWFNLSCLSSVLTINWKIPILNFIEMI